AVEKLDEVIIRVVDASLCEARRSASHVSLAPPRGKSCSRLRSGRRGTGVASSSPRFAERNVYMLADGRPRSKCRAQWNEPCSIRAWAGNLIATKSKKYPNDFGVGDRLDRGGLLWPAQ